MRPLYIQRYLITGLLTFIPIWLTWAVFKFIFSLLSQVNLPWVAAIFSALAGEFPDTIGRLNQGWLVSIFAFVITAVVATRLTLLSALPTAIPFPGLPGTDRCEVGELPLVLRNSVIPLPLRPVVVLTCPAATRSAGE